MEGSDSSDSSASSPRTPLQLSHITQSKIRSFTAPSKPATELKATACGQQSLSQPQTPLSPTLASASSTFDWGGEWSRLVRELNLQSNKAESAIKPQIFKPQLEESPMISSGDATSSEKCNARWEWTEEPGVEEYDHNMQVRASTEKLAKFTNAEDGCGSDTDESVVHHACSDLPRSPKEQPCSPLNATGSSPQTILRGLIRDAHREMMYFTLSHSSFTLDDLRDGLDYAFSMLQAAITKLAILSVLLDDMACIEAADIRNWTASIDCLNPKTCYEPRVPVVFECLSAGEARLALAELVQSRMIVEDEVKRVKLLLEHKAEDLDRKMDLQMCEDDDAALDAWMTAIMVVVIGALYLAVR